jgi:anthranilate synthase component 2
MHGKVSQVVHDGAGLFAGIASPFQAARYHSLLVRKNTLPLALLPVASTPEDELMAVRHATRPLFGVQFHPESIASQYGHQLLGNFLSLRSIA